VLRTHFRHQIVGYVRKYLGRTFSWIEIVSSFIGGFGALTVYLIGIGVSLAAIFGGSALHYSLIYFVIGAILLFFGLRVIKVCELWLVPLFIVLIAIIAVVSGGHFQLANFQSMHWYNILVPYGVILFAFGGKGGVVPLREVLRREPEKIKKAVLISSLVPLIIYIIFSIAIVGVTGASTTEVATVGLGQMLGDGILLFGNIFAVLAMASGFINLGLIMEEIMLFDFRLPKVLSWLLIILVPLVIFLSQVGGFIKIMAIAGSLTFGISGINSVLMYWKAKKAGDRTPEFSMPKFKIIGLLLIAMFAAGIGYVVAQLL
ncbi:MAG: aromatic amino acid transport family protein, partial [Parcubacteria group bacterium]